MNPRIRIAGVAALLLLLLVGFGIMPHGVSAAACTTTVPAAGDIQAAITAAAPGDVICLSAGTYTPAATIVINKTLTLQGPQFGVDPRPSEGSARVPGGPAEAVITGGGTLSTILQIAASDVVLDGFEVSNGTGDMIASLAGSNIAGVAIRNLIVHNATGDEGMQIRDCDNCVIEYNYVYDTFGDGINLCCGSTGGLIQFNDLMEIDSENAALYVYEATETTIQCNLIDTTSINEGIKLGAKGGTDAALSGGSILYNTIRNTAQDGIAIYMSATDVMGNDVSASASENGAIYVAQGVNNIAITYNAIHDNTFQTFKWGDPGAVMIGSGGAQSAATITVNNNNITTNSPNGATNKATGTLNAENNWWGDASGPSGQGPGSGDAVSTNVDFDPWLTQPAEIPAGPCAVGATIIIDKVAPGGGTTQFTFDVSWSNDNVVLTDGDAPYETIPPLPAGNYSITEIDFPPGWSLDNADCVGPDEISGDPANLTVGDGDTWVCTFTDQYTPPPTNTCPVEYGDAYYTDLLGAGMGDTKSHKVQAKINLPNHTNLVDIYGQMVAKDFGQAKYVRFLIQGKPYVQVNAITAPIDHQFGAFWYGADLYDAGTPPSWVKGRWFLKPIGVKGHIPRALVLYATYAHATDRWVNVWDTFTPSEGEVDWKPGWVAERQIIVPIAAPLGPVDFHVEVALADNDKDARPVWVTVSAGPVSQTQMPAVPSNGNLLNLMNFTLQDVPAGTDEIVITVYSPSPTLDGVEGDSAAVVGMAANYQCLPISTEP